MKIVRLTWVSRAPKPDSIALLHPDSCGLLQRISGAPIRVLQLGGLTRPQISSDGVAGANQSTGLGKGAFQPAQQKKGNRVAAAPLPCLSMASIRSSNQ